MKKIMVFAVVVTILTCGFMLFKNNNGGEVMAEAKSNKKVFPEAPRS